MIQPALFAIILGALDARPGVAFDPRACPPPPAERRISAPASLAAARVADAAGRYRLAVTLYQKGIVGESERDEVSLSALGTVYLRLGSRLNARATWDEVLAIPYVARIKLTSSGSSFLSSAQALQAGRFRESFELLRINYDSLASAAPDMPSVPPTLAVAATLARDGRYREAADEIQKAIKESPRLHESRYFAGALGLATGNPALLCNWLVLTSLIPEYPSPDVHGLSVEQIIAMRMLEQIR